MPLSAERRVRLAAVDDHPIVLRGILWTVQQLAPWVDLVATAADIDGLLAGVGATADVVLLDLDLTGDGGDVDPTVGVRRITAAGPRVVVFTAELRPVPVRLAVAAGAIGVALKSDDEAALVATIAAASTGELACSSSLAHALVTDATLAAHLPPRQRQVLELLAQGVGQHEVGRLLDPPIASDTVLTHLKRAVQTYREMGRQVHSASDAVHQAYRDGHLNIPRSPRPE